MRAGLAIKQEAEEWLSAGEGNEPIRKRKCRETEDTRDRTSK